MDILNRLKNNRQTGYFLIFLMTIPSIGLLIAVKAEADIWIWILIGMVIIGNLSVLILK